eukprot:GILK01006987.1.p1 GENE.GILK01006987.1~~GILK01006987.1.p1  ORF type:complete len:325 (-),score=25.09 GILK01006987.1:47-949(-)
MASSNPCPWNMTGPQCSQTFAQALPAEYTTAVIGFSVVAGVAFLLSAWRNYLLYKASGQVLPSSWLDVQRVFHYASLTVAAISILHCADPNNWNNTFPAVIAELIYEVRTGILISCLIVLLFFWRASAHMRGASLTLHKGERKVLKYSLLLTWAFVIGLSFFEVYGPNRGTIRFIKLLGYAVVTSVCATVTLWYGHSMVVSLSFSCGRQDSTAASASQTRKKMIFFLSLLGTGCVLAVFGMLWYGISSLGDNGQTVPTSFEVSMFDPVYILFVLGVLIFFRAIRSRPPSPLIAKQTPNNL